MSIPEHFCHYIDTVNEWVGKRIASFLIIPLTAIVTFEVVMRYVFNRPQIWTWDINIMLYATLIMLGGGYVFLQGRHVRVDVVVTGLSPRKNQILDLATSIFVLLVVGVLMWKIGGRAWTSLLLREGMGGLWNPPGYPMRMTISLGALLLLFQVLAKFIRDLTAVIHPKGGQ